MPRRTLDRDALLSDMADHVLEHGLQTASLRPLAASAGTSDRMLLYHFGSKDELIAELVDYLAARMTAGLDAALPGQSFASVHELLTALAPLLRSPQFAPYAQVWFDIVALSARGVATHRVSGSKVVRGYLDWITARLPEGEDPARVLALVEGLMVLDAVGQSQVADGAIAAIAPKPTR